MKGVFEISGTSRYDDLITERYHFPRIYLRTAERFVGDWILYRETGSDGGRKAYVAAARVERIDGDPKNGGLFYARVADFLELDHSVPYRDRHGRFAEGFLRDLPSPSDAGRALRGRSVRAIDDADFAAIIGEGLSRTLDPQNAVRLQLEPTFLDASTQSLLEEAPSARKVERMLVNRKIRDAAFRGMVLDAYDCTCAVTGLRMINGGGKAEAQAAHIWPVADGGPDEVQNGLALSATAHWLFDRHLISLDEGFGLLVSHNKVPEELRRLFPPSGQPIRLPREVRLHPRPEYMARHRERFASGT